MKERIKILISRLGISTRAFALTCGLRQNTLSNQLNGVRELSLSTILAISEAYPDVSAEWLLRGEGEMLKQPKASTEEIGVALEKANTLVDTIATVQAALNEEKRTVVALKDRIKELECQLKV